MDSMIDMLHYLYDDYSQSEISAITGIPRSTLSYVLRGIRTLPTQYERSVISAKQTLAYSRLFNAGAPSLDSSLLSTYDITTIKEKEQYVRNVANHLTMGYITRVAVDEDVTDIDQAFIDEHFPKAYNDILYSLRTSTKPIDSWKDYFSDPSIFA